jgi:1,4-alpha-glucan branching enzyme
MSAVIIPSAPLPIVPAPAAPALLAPTAPAAAAHTGMGSIPYAGGVTFRVWAMFADSVSVAGDFNGWTSIALAQDAPGSDYWSVDIPGANVGQAYKFVLPYAAKPGRNNLRMDPYATSLAPDGYGGMNAVVTDTTVAYEGAGYATPAWNEAVLYELHIPTFSSDPTKPPAGTFDTAMVRLPELAQLGVNAIEIMPLGQFPGNAGTGYNPGYIFAVDPDFGGPDGLRTYVNATHSQGIALILDVVYNHVNGLDMWQFDGWSIDGKMCPWCAPQFQRSINGGIYFFQDERAHTPYSHARFDAGRPEVYNYLLDNVKRWLELRFFDGLRFDSVVSIRNIQDEFDNWKLEQPVQKGIDLLTGMNQHVQSTQGWKIMIAEDLQGDSSITIPLSSGGYGFNAQWDDSFCGKVRWAAIAPSDSQRNIGDLAGSIAGMNGINAFRSILYSENHDQDDPKSSTNGRLPQLIGNGQADTWFAKKQSTLAACVVLSAPGIPMLFMGQEFLEYRPFPNYGSDPQPIDWGRKDTYNGIWALYRDMIHQRRNWNNNTRGLRGPNVHVLPVFGDNILVYHRWDQGGGGDDVMIICNFANQSYANYTVGMPRSGMWRIRFSSDSGYYGFGNWPTYDTDANGPAMNGMPCSADVSIGAYTCLVLSQD